MPEFLARRPFSVVHVDAAWDGSRTAIAEKLRTIEPQFEQTVSFGYVDCDIEQEYAVEIGILNVPSVAYYSGGKLCGVVIGMQQDVAGNIERLTLGEPLEQTNRLSRGPARQVAKPGFSGCGMILSILTGIGCMFVLLVWALFPLAQHEIDRTLKFWFVWSAVGIGIIGTILFSCLHRR